MRNVIDEWIGSLHLTAQTFGPTARAAFDTTIAAGALSWPWWVRMFDGAGYWLTLIGGLILLFLRIALALKEWRRK
jgi:hypothetical protein